jgi:hypothetical protein
LRIERARVSKPTSQGGNNGFFQNFSSFWRKSVLKRLVALRQRVLSLPQTYCRGLLNISDRRAMRAVLREMSLAMLEELRDLPSRVTDPHWLDTLEDEKKV